MTGRTAKRADSLNEQIRHQFGSQIMSRFIRAIPQLSSVPGSDDRFDGLLARLEGAEHGPDVGTRPSR